MLLQLSYIDSTGSEAVQIPLHKRPPLTPCSHGRYPPEWLNCLTQCPEEGTMIAEHPGRR